MATTEESGSLKMATAQTKRKELKQKQAARLEEGASERLMGQLPNLSLAWFLHHVMRRNAELSRDAVSVEMSRDTAGTVT